MKLDQEQINYPRDLFSALIDGNSPYAFYLFQWVPYQTEAKRWRLKMCHDVRTFDGREAFGIWPNGSHCGPFKDEEVEFIRISKEQHGGAGWIDPRPEPSTPKVSTMPNNDTTASPQQHVGSTAELACISLWSKDVFWVTMPDGAQLCLRKNWVPGPSTAMGSWVWSISAQSYPAANAEAKGPRSGPA